ALTLQRHDERRIELQQRLAAGANDQGPLTPTLSPLGRASTPNLSRPRGQRLGGLEFRAILPLRADEIRIAEGADRPRTTLLASPPEIAAGEAQKHRRAARLSPFALQGQKHLFDSVAQAKPLYFA